MIIGLPPALEPMLKELPNPLTRNWQQWFTEVGRMGVPTVRVVSGTYATVTMDETVVCNKATPFTVTLSPIQVGRFLVFKNLGAGTVTLSGTIDGAGSYTLLTGEAVTLQCYASNLWIVISKG